MPRIEVTKVALLERRADLMRRLREREGYTDAELAVIFNLDRSQVFRIRRQKPRTPISAQR